MVLIKQITHFNESHIFFKFTHFKENATLLQKGLLQTATKFLQSTSEVFTDIYFGLSFKLW